MKKITDIKQQAKNSGRVSIYIDDKYSFSLSKDQLTKQGLYIGQELAEAEIKQFKIDSQFGKLRDNTFKWLALRPRSEYELDQYLKRKTDNPDLREQVKDLLKSNNYIDDEQFARSWIQNRTIIKPMSTYRLKQELMQKGVAKDIIDSSLAEADLDEAEALRELIRKRRHRYDSEQKLMAYLARQGFSYPLIKDALAELNQ